MITDSSLVIMITELAKVSRIVTYFKIKKWSDNLPAIDVCPSRILHRHYTICSGLSCCSTVQPYLGDISHVYSESALERLARKPTDIPLNLQALNMIYLEDESQKIRIKLWREVDKFVCQGARGIVVHHE
jgi:hypothetical protein